MRRKKIAIITARGGSKRIPKKNIKDFLGKPIIAYSIEAAVNSALFDIVMVSTDDSEIAEISKKYGAEVPFFRSQKNSDDFATTAEVLLEVLNEYKKRGKEFDYLCCIYPTAPFATADKLKDCFDLMVQHSAHSAFPVVKFSYPIQRALRINGKGDLEFIWKENTSKRSQDLETTYHDAGQFYWLNGLKFLDDESLLTGKTFPYKVPEIEVQDIDSIEDWEIAELKYKTMDKLVGKFKN